MAFGQTQEAFDASWERLTRWADEGHVPTLQARLHFLDRVRAATHRVASIIPRVCTPPPRAVFSLLFASLVGVRSCPCWIFIFIPPPPPPPPHSAFCSPQNWSKSTNAQVTAAADAVIAAIDAPATRAAAATLVPTGDKDAAAALKEATTGKAALVDALYRKARNMCGLLGVRGDAAAPAAPAASATQGDEECKGTTKGDDAPAVDAAADADADATAAAAADDGTAAAAPAETEAAGDEAAATAAAAAATAAGGDDTTKAEDESKKEDTEDGFAATAKALSQWVALDKAYPLVLVETHIRASRFGSAIAVVNAWLKKGEVCVTLSMPLLVPSFHALPLIVNCAAVVVVVVVVVVGGGGVAQEAAKKQLGWKMWIELRAKLWDAAGVPSEAALDRASLIARFANSAPRLS